MFINLHKFVTGLTLFKGGSICERSAFIMEKFCERSVFKNFVKELVLKRKTK